MMIMIMINNLSISSLPYNIQLGFDRRVLLESAITEIRLPEDLYQMFVKEMQNSYSMLEGVSNGNVFDNKGVFNITGFPTFDLQIPGALLHFPPELYFLKKDVVGISNYFLQIVPNQFSVG